MNQPAQFLDRLIPLRDASHAEAHAYSIDIPMRYSEFLAFLVDGRKTRLRNAKQFVGWWRHGSAQCFLCLTGDGAVEILTDDAETPESRVVTEWAEISVIVADDPYGLPAESGWDRVRKYVAPDGRLMLVRLARQLRRTRIASRQRDLAWPSHRPGERTAGTVASISKTQFMDHARSSESAI